MRQWVMVAIGLAGGASLAGAQAAESYEGDSAAVARIDAQTRAVYDQVQSWRFLLTSKNLTQEPGAVGTEIQAGPREGEPVRTIAGGWTPQGKFGAEYYRVNGQLVFVYESFEGFQDRGTMRWRNFKGNPGWERRTYLENGKVVYTEANGPSPAPDVTRLIATMERLVAELTSH
jgi:hypothetical protein